MAAGASPGEDVVGAKKKRVKDGAYLNRVVSLGCLICGKRPTIHHVHKNEGMSQRASDYRSLPLCSQHHQHGGHGVAIEAGRKAFEANFGTEEELLEQVWDRLGIEEDVRVRWRARDFSEEASQK